MSLRLFVIIVFCSTGDPRRLVQLFRIPHSAITHQQIVENHIVKCNGLRKW